MFSFFSQMYSLHMMSCCLLSLFLLRLCFCFVKLTYNSILDYLIHDKGYLPELKSDISLHKDFM